MSLMGHRTVVQPSFNGVYKKWRKVLHLFVDNSFLFPIVKNFQNRITSEVIAEVRHHTLFETQCILFYRH